MCGIVCYWAREALLTREQYHTLMIGAQRRGEDGFGVAIYNPNTQVIHDWRLLVVGSYISEYCNVLDFIEKYARVGSIIIASCRATPETENTTTEDMLQPIVNDDFILVHNGGVTDSVREDIPYNYKTKIDSEAIIAAYDWSRNMKTTMEYLSGSFAFVMLDKNKKKLYGVTSFNPLAHMYIKGYGYFMHSDEEVLREVLQSITGATRDGMNVWESWYCHYLPGYTIIETDIESGSQNHTKYKPRFLHPVWDSRKNNGHKRTYVVASGGIDSGLTAYLLKLVGRDVSMIHFNYGQKSQEAENWAIIELSNNFNYMPYMIFDLSVLFAGLCDPSMLSSLRKNLKITSGGSDIKSTIAWVAGRNAIFASVAMAFAEASILNWNYEQVDIAAGWAQLSEETGGYPDNSFQFARTLNDLKDYGYITGSRIKFLPVLQRLTKTECWVLGSALDFPFEATVSCDDPKMIHDHDWNRTMPALCQECGSTKLSIIAADRAGVKDKRRFTTKRQKLSEPKGAVDSRTIIDRLILTHAEREILKGIVG